MRGTRLRGLMAALLACGVLGAAGCQTDNAAKKDIKHAGKDVKKATHKAASDVKNATN